MKAIILAAGQGTRLKKYTENLPKGMLSFMGKTIIERQIETYRACGIEKIVIVRGFAADKINYLNVTYYDNKEYESTNMVESLLTAKSEFDDDVIVSYSDILFEADMLREMIKSQGEYIVAVDDGWQEYWKMRYGKVDFDTESLSIDSGNKIKELGLENPPLDTIDARYIGLLKFSKVGLQMICDIMDHAKKNYAGTGKGWQQSGKPVEKAYMTDLLNALIEDGENIHAKRFMHGWIEFDTNEDYENALEWIKDGQINRVIKL